LKLTQLRAQLLTILLLTLSLNAASDSSTPSTVCAACIKKNLDYLAGPELHGRGSGTEDEHHAAQYIADQLKSYGLKPAAENGQYIQTGTLSTRTVTGMPVVTVKGAKPLTLTQGKEIAIFQVPQPDVSAPLQKLDLNDASVSPASVKSGAAVLLKLKSGNGGRGLESVFTAYMASKAAIVIMPVAAESQAMFQRAMQNGPRPEKKIADDATSRPDGLLVNADSAAQLWAMAEGTAIKLHADVTPWQTSHTWNVLAKIDGTKNKQQIILLSAHLDHLGVKNGKMYPGADDDGSGTVAVMELARALGKEKAPQRTVMFALWGSEEAGLVGARYFLKHSTFDLRDVVANLEFEMIGRADPKVKLGDLWLTGWERTNLGPELAAHGAQLVGDPHPDNNFFTRSDNYALAKDGIIAQTVSSYGLHKDYHQPTDTVENIDWQHLDSAIGSMIAPVSWLANSDFTPQWTPGQKP
jgi:aminopeptidase YwaD